ncbi:unnamed protein product [Mytilus coruscus]|uniref:Uncharacterized protein n=1 Tax=Mytilus coruscus TaxID=42192 RepID=A0A6J8ATH8_MYTCO|nr:unnamed protein product [Mytilus coruscus]
MDELTLFNEDSIPVHVLNLSTCITLENTSTSSDTQFPASQDLFSSADEGLDGSCDLFSELSVAGNSECDKKRKFQISDDSDSHSVSLLSGKRPRNFRNKYRKIGLEHIAPLIISVLSLADITLTLDDLPSISTAAKLTSELGIVARNHVKDELALLDKITMQRDATTKKGRHFVGLEIATGEKVLTAGLREVSNGKASTYVSCTNEIIKDIEITTKSNDKILPKVKSFMTDRSATEHKANTLLSAEIHDENNNTETHNFKCAVHPLLQFSDVCTKQIVKLEKDKTVNIDGSEICIANPELVLTENGIKLFYGPDFPDDDIYSYLLKPCNLDYFTKDIIVKFCFELKVKCMQLFKDFMPTGKYYAPNDEILNICISCPSNNISVESLMAKMDNCIVNAPTYNTNSMESVQYNDKDGKLNQELYELTCEEMKTDFAAAYFVFEEFIQNQQIHTPSTTIIQEDIFLKPELLVGKYFIHTWTDNGQDEQWKGRIYSYDGGLFENMHETDYRNKSEICIANPELVLTENGIKLFYGPDFPDDDIYSYLLKPCNLDYFTKDIIVKFCFELKVKCMQLFKDFMPTGKYYAPNDEILNICISCPSNNISVESLMAKMDNCIVNAPTYNTNSMESVIMFKNNNTQEWLHKKTDAETTEIIANARTHNNKFLSDIKCRKKDLFHQNIETIRQRQINESNRQVKLNVEMQTALDVFNRNGIWNTDSKIKEEL